MGVNFIIIVENQNKKTQKEVNRKFGVSKHFGDEHPEWKLFEYDGKHYASWLNTPRYFQIDEQNERWEYLRKYLVKVREYFGGGDVMMTNDVVSSHTPESEEDDDPLYLFTLGWKLSEEELAEPDYEQYPELKEIGELKGLIW